MEAYKLRGDQDLATKDEQDALKLGKLAYDILFM